MHKGQQGSRKCGMHVCRAVSSQCCYPLYAGMYTYIADMYKDMCCSTRIYIMLQRPRNSPCLGWRLGERLPTTLTVASYLAVRECQWRTCCIYRYGRMRICKYMVWLGHEDTPLLEPSVDVHIFRQPPVLMLSARWETGEHHDTFVMVHQCQFVERCTY